MLVECVQTVAGWLADPSTGVNARLATVPRYAGDDAPPSVTVVQAFRHSEAARGQAPQTGLPAVEVTLWQDPATETRPGVAPYAADLTVDVAVRYVPAKTQDTALQMRQASYTLRAVRKVLAARGVGPHATVNDVQLQTVGAVRYLAAYASDGDTVTTGALIVTLTARDFYTRATS